MIKDYAYARADFRGDPDLLLPNGEQWDDRGEKYATTLCFYFYVIFHFFVFLLILIHILQFYRHRFVKTYRGFTYRETRCN